METRASQIKAKIIYGILSLFKLKNIYILFIFSFLSSWLNYASRNLFLPPIYSRVVFFSLLFIPKLNPKRKPLKTSISSIYSLDCWVDYLLIYNQHRTKLKLSFFSLIHDHWWNHLRTKGGFEIFFKKKLYIARRGLEKCDCSYHACIYTYIYFWK